MAEIERTAIEGVQVATLERHPDDRGFVAELFRRSWIPGMREALQLNLSRSRANVLRGLHFHRKQADYWAVLEGEAFVGLYDLRAGSPTEGVGESVTLRADDLRCLYIPRGVAHGFFTPTGVLMQYVVDEYYDGGDEFGVAWDDAAVGIGWPSAEPILSERDRSNPRLADLGDRPAYP